MTHADASTVLIFVLLIGILTGLRSFTPLAVLSWAAWIGWISLAHTPLSFLGTAAAAIITSLLAAGELIADKLPKTPNRTSAIGLSGRIIVGALAGTAFALAGQQAWFAGAAIGVVGAIAGTYLGYFARSKAAAAVGKDLPVALVEDAITIAGSLFVATRL